MARTARVCLLRLAAALVATGFLAAGTASAEPPEDEWGDADDEFGELDAAAAVKALGIELEGRISVEHFGYLKGLPNKNNGRDAVDLALTVRAGSDDLSGTGTFLIRHDFAEPSRQRIEAEEAYLETRFGDFELRAGKAIDSWGTASLYNPTDLIGPKDLRDPIASEKLGTWMVRGRYILGPLRIDGYYMPVPQPHLLPSPEGFDAQGRALGRSRWIIGTPTVSPVPIVTKLDVPDDFPPTLDNVQLALRTVLKAGGFDASLGYGYFIDRFPTTRRTTKPSMTQIEVDIVVSYERVHVVTADFETTFGKLRLAGEALAWLTDDFDSKDPAVDDPQLTLLAGGDYRTAPFFDDHYAHVFFEGLITRPLVGTLAEDFTADLRRPLDLAAIGRVVYGVGENLKFEVTVASALDVYDLVLPPSSTSIFKD